MVRRVDPSHTREWVRDVVRSGLMSSEQLHAEVESVVAADHPDLPAESTARTWVAEETDRWRREAAEWADPTDYDRLQRAFAQIESADIVVLQACTDHWAARELLDSTACRGVAWFTPTDVWHAIDEPMLEVNLWHPTTANVAPGDALLEEVLAAFSAAGLSTHFDEGRIEVAARWQRRPPA